MMGPISDPLYDEVLYRGLPMTEINPAGTLFLGLIEELIDLLQDPNVSRIEVVIGGHEVDENDKPKLVDGKESFALRPFAISGMDTQVQEALRREIESGPVNLLMIFCVDRTQTGVPVRFAIFGEAGKKRTPGVAGMSRLEKTAFADYLNRQVKSK
jgi:hypothetical protein